MANDGRPRYRNIVADSARWEGFEFRDGDIVISTPPKCGTTWMQMICALLIFQTPTFDRTLDLISPWLDMQTRDRASVIADLDAQVHRRFIKSHTPFDGLPYSELATYICVGRDPRDVGFSWDNHMANLDLATFIGAREAAVGLDDLAELMPDGPSVVPDSELERFRLWMEADETPLRGPGGLLATLHHLTTFWEARQRPNVVLVRYEDLKADLEAAMRSLAARLGIEVDEADWPTLVDAATFNRMRERADEIVPDSSHDIWQDNRQFFHRGSCGQWRDVLPPTDIDRYHVRVAELADPELAAWLHGGTG